MCSRPRNPALHPCPRAALLSRSMLTLGSFRDSLAKDVRKVSYSTESVGKIPANTWGRGGGRGMTVDLPSSALR